MRCERCGTNPDCQCFGAVWLCEACLLLIVAEWSIKRAEFGALASS
jgi:hypothetical protein